MPQVIYTLCGIQFFDISTPQLSAQFIDKYCFRCYYTDNIKTGVPYEHCIQSRVVYIMFMAENIPFNLIRIMPTEGVL